MLRYGRGVRPVLVKQFKQAGGNTHRRARDRFSALRFCLENQNEEAKQIFFNAGLQQEFCKDMIEKVYA